MDSREKLAALASELPAVMQAASQHLKKLAAQVVAAEKRASAAEAELRLAKIARRMEDRGLDRNVTFDDKVAHLRELDSEKLASFEQAIEMAAGGFRLGQVQTVEEGVSGAVTGDELDRYILSQEAYSDS